MATSAPQTFPLTRASTFALSFPSVAGPVMPGGLLNPSPDIQLNFSTNQVYDAAAGTISNVASRLAVTRATPPTAYVNDSVGNWVGVAANLPRISNLGLLVEEARTNSIRNNSMQGAVSGVIGSGGALPTNWSINNPAGLTVTLGTPTVVRGVDVLPVTVSGVSVGTNFSFLFESSSNVASANGQTWTSSVFLQITAGGLTQIPFIEIDEMFNGGFLAGSQINITPSSAWGRFDVSRTNSQATTNQERMQLCFRVLNGENFNVSFLLGWPQFEQGASVTSPIRTTNAAVTRAADVVTMTSPPAFGSSLSLYAQGIPQSPLAYASNQPILETDNGTSNERAILQRVATTGTAQVQIISGGSGPSLGATIWQSAASGKTAVAVATNDMAYVFNSVTPSTNTVTAAPATQNSVKIGSTITGATFFNGFIAQAAIWATQRLSNATLQAITDLNSPTTFGAIRWDAWYSNDPSSAAFTTAAEVSSTPIDFRYRAPLHANLSTNPVTWGYSQATFDNEINVAANAGLDYWAYLKYGSSGSNSAINNGLAYHLASSIKDRMKFCLMRQASDLGFPNNYTAQVADTVAYMLQSNYMKVGGRPLLYIFFNPGDISGSWGGNAANFRAMITDLRKAAVSVGLQSPYIIDIRGDITNTATYSVDATSDYITNIPAGLGTPYSSLATTAQNDWTTRFTASQIAPTCMVGWDQRPRQQYQNITFTAWIVTATVNEFTTHLTAAKNYMRANPGRCPMQTSLVYAWDECTEGGVMPCPTVGDPVGSLSRAFGLAK